MDCNAIICAGLIVSSCSVAGTQVYTQKRKKNSLNVATDVPGILITVISTPMLACFED